MGATTLDIIIPFYNEEEVLAQLIERLQMVFADSETARLRLSRVRYIFVDDGSQDRSAQIVAEHIRGGVPAILYRLSRNFGHQPAVVAGLDHASADLVAVIDADLQDPPEEIVPMIAKWREGFDVVYGMREKRKEDALKKLGYYLSEGLIPRDSGDFCLMDKRVVAAIRSLPEHLRFIRGLRAWVGFPNVAHIYERTGRAAGAPKYSFKTLYRLATDGLTASSIRPLKVAQVLAIIFFLISGVIAVTVVYRLLSTDASHAELSLSYLQLLLTSTTGFAILFCLYIMSAYIGRTYLEAKGRPSYILMETVEPTTDEAQPSAPSDER
jgi:glycosyltransferase involved in cell wall biosynthesis